MNPKVSIIVPMFNVEKFICTCAKSLFSQSFNEIEYIFIDDASTDSSLSVLRQVLELYPNRINQVQIIQNLSNIGAALSRAKGIQQSISEYILMIDSDDFIDYEMVKILYKKAVDTKAEIVFSDIFFEYVNHRTSLKDYVSDNKINNIKGLLSDTTISSSLCNKLIKRSLFIKSEFEKSYGLIYNEDKFLLLKMLLNVNSVTQINESYYYYVQYNFNSVSKNKAQKHFEDMILFWSLTENLLDKYGLLSSLITTIEIAKIKQKTSFLIDTHITELRIRYAGLYSDIYKKHKIRFLLGERLMLKFIDLKLFKLTQLLHNFLLIKNEKAIYLNNKLYYLYKNRF